MSSHRRPGQTLIARRPGQRIRRRRAASARPWGTPGDPGRSSRRVENSLAGRTGVSGCRGRLRVGPTPVFLILRGKDRAVLGNQQLSSGRRTRRRDRYPRLSIPPHGQQPLLLASRTRRPVGLRLIAVNVELAAPVLFVGELGQPFRRLVGRRQHEEVSVFQNILGQVAELDQTGQEEQAGGRPSWPPSGAGCNAVPPMAGQPGRRGQAAAARPGSQLARSRSAITCRFSKGWGLLRPRSASRERARVPPRNTKQNARSHLRRRNVLRCCEGSRSGKMSTRCGRSAPGGKL